MYVGNRKADYFSSDSVDVSWDINRIAAAVTESGKFKLIVESVDSEFLLQESRMSMDIP